MIANLDAKVYTPIAEALREAYEGIYVSGEYVNAPPMFPAVCIEETDNRTAEDHLSTSADEQFSIVTYEVNVYSNLKTGRKKQAREIMEMIDGMFYDSNFIRLSMAPVPNMADNSIYRLTARYRAETDGTNMYRR